MTTIPLPAALSMQGKRALVTGAASGIGRATAAGAAQLGAGLLLTDRAPLDETRADVEAAGGTARSFEGDLTDDAFIASLFAGSRCSRMAHCAAILKAAALATRIRTGTSASIG